MTEIRIEVDLPPLAPGRSPAPELSPAWKNRKAGHCPECDGTGMVWSDGCTCGAGPHGYYGMHERHCGAEPCPAGCPVRSETTGEPVWPRPE